MLLNALTEEELGFTTSQKRLLCSKHCHTVSAELIRKVLKNGIENNGEVKGFRSGVVVLLGYFISHEGHHRGNILLTLKQCGFKSTDNLKYGI